MLGSRLVVCPKNRIYVFSDATPDGPFKLVNCPSCNEDHVLHGQDSEPVAGIGQVLKLQQAASIKEAVPPAAATGLIMAIAEAVKDDEDIGFLLSMYDIEWSDSYGNSQDYFLKRVLANAPALSVIELGRFVLSSEEQSVIDAASKRLESSQDVAAAANQSIGQITLILDQLAVVQKSLNQKIDIGSDDADNLRLDLALIELSHRHLEDVAESLKRVVLGVDAAELVRAQGELNANRRALSRILKKSFTPELQSAIVTALAAFDFALSHLL